MVVDARSIPADSRVETDLCIVGGGTAGITLAREFIGAPFRVCLLESGGREPDPETQSLDSGENIGHPYYPLETARSRSLGGSSTLWHVPIGGDRVGARMRPLDPIDFEERHWVPYSGWPFSKQHLDPYYERAQAICRIEPPTYDVQDWEDRERCPRIPLAGDEVQTIVYKFCCRDLFAREYPEEVTRADNITTCLHANALEIDSNAMADHVARLRVATLQGNEFYVAAKIFVLAIGGIETPRLMLLSRKKQPAGLGNQHDLVGRFFMEHLHFWSGILVVNDPSIFDRTALYNDVHTVSGVAVIGKLALGDHVLRRERLLNQNVQLMPCLRPDPFKYRKIDAKPVASLKALLRGEGFSRCGEHLRSVISGWNDVAAAGFRKIRTTLTGLPTRPVFIFANMTEQVPNPESRVTLGPDLDAFGQNRVRLNWKMTKQDIRSVVRTQEIVGKAFEQVGWGRLYRELLDDGPPTTTHGGYHHMGTTRMHADPRQGVVDADCRVHGIRNLYIAGPSVFPTGGYANPVLTTLALTLRLADHMKGLMRAGM